MLVLVLGTAGPSTNTSNEKNKIKRVAKDILKELNAILKSFKKYNSNEVVLCITNVFKSINI